MMGSGKMEEVTIDDRGRILIPKEIRDALGLHPGSSARLEMGKDRLIITPPVSQEKFIKEMEGFITEGDAKVDPLKLKEIWGKPASDD